MQCVCVLIERALWRQRHAGKAACCWRWRLEGCGGQPGEAKGGQRAPELGRHSKGYPAGPCGHLDSRHQHPIYGPWLKQCWGTHPTRDAVCGKPRRIPRRVTSDVSVYDRIGLIRWVMFFLFFFSINKWSLELTLGTWKISFPTNL